ncbi:MAG: ABC transporter substrate-binding protein [Actinobacteria bacterium]|nr:ABC transporter substrate-binding protein [Actinomycetota bacterium]MCB8996027.1 ABC transporter substrate-binding protein [Actinomycetota bacterium]HRY08425.1 ABC transporter substrate-binding protein [Candidatus Nanopelagicales bacterium]
MARLIGIGRTAALVAAAGLALSACGGDSGSDTTSSPTPSGVPSVTADETLAAQVPEAIKQSGTLTFGTDASYAPSEFLADDGTTIVGFDVDLGKAIAAKLGLQGQFENSTFDSLIVGVQNGKFPASMSSFTITPEREEQVNMISYFSAGTSWAVETGNPSGISVEDPCGKTVAVQKATVQVDDIEAKNDDCKSAGKPEINIQQYGLQSEATTAVVSGKADAMLADSPVVAYAIEQSGKLEQLGEVYDSAPYGIVVPKEETEFATAIQGAVDALIADGTYMAILDEWGVGNGAVPAAEVNPSSS